MTGEFPRGATSTTKVGCRSYVHSEPPRRKGLKISGLLVSRPTAVELMPPQRPRLPIGATLCSARRPSLSIFLATAASPAATTAAAASASTPPFQLLVLRRIAAAADVILVVVQWGGQGINSRAGGHPLLDALSIFCMSAAAVAAEKGAVQPQVPAVLFIISSANAELAVLSLPRVTILFLGGGNMGREVGEGIRFGHEFSRRAAAVRTSGRVWVVASGHAGPRAPTSTS